MAGRRALAEGQGERMKETVLITVDDLVSDFLYYGRKEDEDLPRGAIEDAIEDGSITIEEIVARFETGLRDRIDALARGM